MCTSPAHRPALAVNLPAQFEHGGMGTQISGDSLKLLICFDVIAQIKPALLGLDVPRVLRWNCVHFGGSFHGLREIRTAMGIGVNGTTEVLSMASISGLMVVGPRQSFEKHQFNSA